MNIATLAQVLAPCPRVVVPSGKKVVPAANPMPHEWDSLFPPVIDSAPEPVAFICKWCLIILSLRVLNEVNAP